MLRKRSTRLPEKPSFDYNTKPSERREKRLEYVAAVTEWRVEANRLWEQAILEAMGATNPAIAVADIGAASGLTEQQVRELTARNGDSA